MREPFFRFDIHNFRGHFHIRIGCAWDNSKAHYQPISKTAFGTLYAGTYAREIDAQAAIKSLKDFLTFRRGGLK